MTVMVPPSYCADGGDMGWRLQVSRIETEQLLLQLVDVELEKRRKESKFHGKFAGLTHYFGYEGRCSFPTNFDAAYVPTHPSAYPA